jgi:hypothetical protein
MSFLFYKNSLLPLYLLLEYRVVTITIHNILVRYLKVLHCMSSAKVYIFQKSFIFWCPITVFKKIQIRHKAVSSVASVAFSTVTVVTYLVWKSTLFTLCYLNHNLFHIQRYYHVISNMFFSNTFSQYYKTYRKAFMKLRGPFCPQKIYNFYFYKGFYIWCLVNSFQKIYSLVNNLTYISLL